MGNKFDKGKPRPELLPARALEEISEVLAFGANKYDDQNWRTVVPNSRYIGAALRHLFAYMRGEDRDPETGLSHLSHAACCILFLIEYHKTNTGKDDRYKYESGSDDGITHGCICTFQQEDTELCINEGGSDGILHGGR